MCMDATQRNSGRCGCQHRGSIDKENSNLKKSELWTGPFSEMCRVSEGETLCPKVSISFDSVCPGDISYCKIDAGITNQISWIAIYSSVHFISSVISKDFSRECATENITLVFSPSLTIARLFF